MKQFDANLLVAAKGLSWQYNSQGLLIKTRFASQQRRAETEEEEAAGDEAALEEEAKRTGEEVAIGLRGTGTA